ncbi:hypothetical protein [Carboxylicivirga sp. N1Y90]|uniref:hypothetical protein n=1 Tax=Carboxylicivirga fragile TaxID=3417571 RepID=UPI003D3313D7|nr:hypothetical protein [Marinilabiliaceae bacterium N1Y90]
MKNQKFSLLFFTIGLLLFTLTSCEKNDEANPITASIVGEWKKVDIDIQTHVNGMNIIDFYTTYGGLTKEEAEDALEILLGTMDFPLNLILREDDTYNASMQLIAPYDGRYVLDVNNRTLTLDSGKEYESIFEVLLLNETDMILKHVETSNLDDSFPEMGKKVVTMTIDLKRVQ